MITRPGGYCPMCDTVYDRPHECVGKTNTKMTNFDRAKIGYDKISVFERRIWNEAIEAAALKADSISAFSYVAAAIRSLKK